LQPESKCSQFVQLITNMRNRVMKWEGLDKAPWNNEKRYGLASVCRKLLLMHTLLVGISDPWPQIIQRQKEKCQDEDARGR
jgi:hypothetical protein